MTGNRREVADSRVQLQSTLLLSGLRGLLSVKADLCDCEPVEGSTWIGRAFTAQLLQTFGSNPSSVLSFTSSPGLVGELRLFCDLL